jgi:hypothetical protein
METLYKKLENSDQNLDISVSFNREYYKLAKWLLSYFETKNSEGLKFNHNETVKIGWITVMLRSQGSKILEIYEPNFSSIPIEWIRGVNNTLRHLTLQKEVCSQSGVDAAYPSMRQSGIISPQFFESHTKFEMVREPSIGNDSGWIFRDDGYDGYDGAHCSLYQIGCVAPAVIPFLALPSGSIVRWTGSDIEIVTPSKAISAAGNDFLTRLMRSSYLAYREPS